MTFRPKPIQKQTARAAPVSLTPIATIRSCYPERFGIPRQAGLVPAAIAQIIFEATEANKLALRGLEAFSHLWVIFLF
jgi:tRNA (Thr-GGU) A37 N-methylase